MNGLLTRLALGASGGLAGTVAIRALMAASQKVVPRARPPMSGSPGQFMVEKAEQVLPGRIQGNIPERAETAAAEVLSVGYGVTFGVAYAALRPEGGNAVAEGLVLGTACWAAGYLGWLPALGLMPPVWKQTAAQAAMPLAEHLVYGMTTVAAYGWLRERTA